ncbi:MAG: methionine gamma-lyase family protein [Oscillospiraceae bacterium]|nr:methionine gamma-lyase family protein [Oscillospiraceae bacterium]
MNPIDAILTQSERDCAPIFANIAETERICFARVLSALQTEKVGVQHFAPSTGYGYDDAARDTLERVFAAALQCESALVRPQIASGTHALAVALFGLLRPGDQLLSATGRPYDTMNDVIGIDQPTDGSLRSWGVSYHEVALTDAGQPDFKAIRAALTPQTRVVLVQRSRGYAWRPSLTLAEIGAICDAVHQAQPDALVLVDNCYGEFTCIDEPSSVGADLLVGSLIKNPGGGLAPTGGYIAGKEATLDRVATRLTSPGIGREVGSYAASYRPFYQGLYMAPHTVAQALMGAALAARAFEMAGFAVQPRYDAPRSDIIQAIRLDAPERLIKFCQAVQQASPVDSYALPEPWDMPGYQHQVIMAAGTFVSGASIELSADAPMRPPYIAYWQGGLTYAHCRLAVERTLTAMGL